MTKPHEEHTFYHSLKLDNPTKALDNLVGKIIRCGDIVVKRDLLPTLIDLHFPQTLVESDIGAVRKLMHAFKASQQRNFIRCITSLELAATSDCVDAFYSRTNNHHQHVDAFCTVRSITGNYVELKVVVPFETRQNTMIREMSRLTDCTIPRDGDPEDMERQIQNMYQFCSNPHINYILSELAGPCHVVLVTNYERDEYVPIPVYGFGVEDAVRRYQVSNRDMQFTEQAYGSFFPVETDAQDTMILLLQLIRERMEDGVRIKSAAEIYALAELLISYFMITVGSSVSNREIVMFDLQADMHTSSLISLRYSERLQQ